MIPSRTCFSASLATLLLAGLIAPYTSIAQNAQTKSPLGYANGLVGTAPLDNQKLIGNAPPPGEQIYSGFTSPGATLPHSSTDIAPINANLDVEYVMGVPATYYYPNRRIFGFSSGSQVGPILMAAVGDWTPPPARTASVYDKSRERSSPGYYSVYLDDFDTTAEMTATTWTGLYRFTFPKTEAAHILLDLGRPGGSVEIVGDKMVRGQGHPRGGRTMGRGSEDSYFVAEFSHPFATFGTFKQIPPNSDNPRAPLVGTRDVEPAIRTIDGNFAGVYLNFSTERGEQVLVKIAHGHSYEEAEQRLKAEDRGWQFDQVKRQAEEAWAPRLNQIEVSGGTGKEKTLFYSCLMHSFASPRLVARKGEQFRAMNGETKTADYDRYGPVPFWDTGRNQIVLLSLLEPKLELDIMRSQLDMARESGYMGTSFHGDNAVFLYLGAWERGLDFDWNGTYEYLRKNATDPKGPRHFLDEYVSNGWIADVIPDRNPSPPYADGKAGVATTLEYSWDDYALALYAKKLGRNDDYQMFIKRAGNYHNVFDPSIGFMRGKTADGKWISFFDPGEPYYNFMMKEASGWSTLWLVPQDVAGLGNLLGGREKFAAKLDEFFSTPYTAKGICRDCTGMVGEYVQGNQPDQQTAYYYAWAGQPWKTQKLVRQILTEMYGSDRSGFAFPGMDDQGATSSWYVMSALGFYPVDPSSPNYILGSPVFTHSTIHLGNGKDFTIEARHNSTKNIYIESATLNGKPWNKPWFSHSDIANGATLVLEMGPTPNEKWGNAPDAAPPSMSTNQ